MYPLLWHPPVALTPAEQVVYARIKYAKLFRFLRDHRLTLFSDAFQGEFAVLDSSPLAGAGRVEDTYNLLGHAVHKAVDVLAVAQGREPTAVAYEAGASLIAGSSLKAALDCNWDDVGQREAALRQILFMLE